jgi:hypothetical protein
MTNISLAQSYLIKAVKRLKVLEVEFLQATAKESLTEWCWYSETIPPFSSFPLQSRSSASI